MNVIAFSPGTMGLCAVACDVVGYKNVVPTGWGTPVYIVTDGMSKKDQQAAIDLITEEASRYGIMVSASRQVL